MAGALSGCVAGRAELPSWSGERVSAPGGEVGGVSLTGSWWPIGMPPMSLRITSIMQGWPGVVHRLTIRSNNAGSTEAQRIIGTSSLGLASLR